MKSWIITTSRKNKDEKPKMIETHTRKKLQSGQVWWHFLKLKYQTLTCFKLQVGMLLLEIFNHSTSLYQSQLKMKQTIWNNSEEHDEVRLQYHHYISLQKITLSVTGADRSKKNDNWLITSDSSGWVNNCRWGSQNKASQKKGTDLYEDTQGTIKHKHFRHKSLRWV